jgi:hypothetical protein
MAPEAFLTSRQMPADAVARSGGISVSDVVVFRLGALLLKFGLLVASCADDAAARRADRS